MPALTLRTDQATEEAIQYLVKHTGASRSEVVRQALLQVARKERRKALRAEALALMNNPVERAAALELTEFMSTPDAW